MQCPIHDDDTEHDVFLIVAASLALSLHMADRDFRDILHQNRYAVGLGEDDVL
jgi:hypothetical protein